MARNIPVRAGTVVKLRELRSGRVDAESPRGIVVRLAPESNFSRAYGRQAYVCVIYKDGPAIFERGRGDLYPIGKAKRVPALCKGALARYLRDGA